MTAPVAFTARRWRCAWCSRSFSRRSSAEGHMETCWRDPAKRTCKTCRHHVPAYVGGPCIAGRPCDCNNNPEECEAGVDLTSGVQVQCALWASADGESWPDN